jgi:hypothetical protein
MASEDATAYNLGTHFMIRKGGTIDNEDYYSDGWYLDASGYKSTVEGTLHYYRSYRNDGKDYMTTFKNNWDNISG